MFPHYWQRGFCNAIGSFEVDIDYRVPFTFGHFQYWVVTNDTSVIDNDINPAERIKSCFNNIFTTFRGWNAVIIRYRFASCAHDFFNNWISGTFRFTWTIKSAAQIINDNHGSSGCEFKSVTFAHPRSGSCYYCDSSIKTDSWHGPSSQSDSLLSNIF